MTEVKADQGASAALATTTEGRPAKGTMASMLDKATVSVEAALPRGIDAGRFVRIVHTELRKNPRLAQTTPGSFLGAVLTSAQLGLEVGSALGQSYLVPFKNHGVDETQLIIGFKGWLALIHRSGQVKSIDARAVREGDNFEFRQGTESWLRHEPADDNESAPVTHYYCIAKTKNGGKLFEVMTRAAVIKHRDRYAKKSNGKITGPWDSHFDDMALKTVFKKVYKWLPVSTDQLQMASSVDEGIIYRDSANAEPEVKYLDFDADGNMIPDEGEDA